LAGFFAAASFAGFLPSIDVSISLWPAAALRGFLAGLAAFAGAACLPTGAAQRLHPVDDVGRRGLRLGRDRFAGALQVDEVDQRGLSAPRTSPARSGQVRVVELVSQTNVARTILISRMAVSSL